MQKKEDNREVVIDVSHLTKDYGYGRGVFDVSIKVHKGECYGYLGPNGAGKSTTIRHIMVFAKPTIGKITIFGQESAPIPSFCPQLSRLSQQLREDFSHFLGISRFPP